MESQNQQEKQPTKKELDLAIEEAKTEELINQRVNELNNTGLFRLEFIALLTRQNEILEGIKTALSNKSEEEDEEDKDDDESE